MDLLLHQQTKMQIDAFLKQPVHAVLIEGPAGSGKGSLATFLAASLLDLGEDKLSGYAYFLRVEPVNGTISIETIRSVQDFMKLKTIGKSPLRRAVLVENAQAMTIEAQNAFLKLLEEPPADTVITLTATHNQTLLPTIYSRVQRIQLKTLEKGDLLAHFVDHTQTDVERAFYMSGGRIGLMHALLTDDQTHPLAASIVEAKEIFTMTAFERLANIDQWAKNKDQLPDLLIALARVCHAVLIQASEKNQTQQIKKSRYVLAQITWAQSVLKHNPNTKLLLTDLMLSM